jgi:antitoxin (DNA-binding transcriptional repressor) of toxin-antitoxin stability system
MQTPISSTEAVRNFSELLNNIKYRGDRYTVIRGGKAAATLGPAEAARPAATMADLREIVRTLPRLDSLDKVFEADVKKAVRAQPPMQKAATWE